MTTRFRRGGRVCKIIEPSYHGHSRYGTVTNPKPDRFGYIRIRLDNQQPSETGYEELESAYEPAMSNVTEFEKRIYTLYHFRHDEVLALRTALEHVNHRSDELTDDMVKHLLGKLPRLP